MASGKAGAPKGHKGWGGRPRGPQMLCGYGCGKLLTAREAGPHVSGCPLLAALNAEMEKVLAGKAPFEGAAERAFKAFMEMR